MGEWWCIFEGSFRLKMIRFILSIVLHHSAKQLNLFYQTFWIASLFEKMRKYRYCLNFHSLKRGKRRLRYEEV